MERLDKYMHDGIELNLFDLIENGDHKISLKELFVFNNDVYVSYQDNIVMDLTIKTVADFFAEHVSADTVITKQIIENKSEGCCGCNGDEVNA
jgi:hypothetical protein